MRESPTLQMLESMEEHLGGILNPTDVYKRQGQYRAQRKRGGASANGAERVQVFQGGLPQVISAEAMQKRF